MVESEVFQEIKTQPRKTLTKHIQPVLIVLLGVAVLIAALQLPSGGAATTKPGTLPTAAAIILVVLGVLLFAQPNNRGTFPSRSSLVNAAIVFGIFFAAIILMTQIGFFLAGCVFIIVLLLYAGERRVTVFLLLPTVTPLVLLILFYSLLAASVPVGPIDLFIHRLIFG